jgi:hypothetical protein
MMRASIWIIAAAGIFALASAVPAAGQGMMQHVDQQRRKWPRQK